MVALDVKSIGYDGPITDSSDTTLWWAAAPGVVPGFVGDGWKPRIGVGDRVVTVGVGRAGGFGVADDLLSEANVALPALSSAGPRWSTITVRRDKTGTYAAGPPVVPGGETTLEVFQGPAGSSVAVPAVTTGESGGVSDTLVALAEVSGSAGAGTISRLVDLRAIRADHYEVPSTLALYGSVWPDGVTVSASDGREFARVGGEWVQAPLRFGYGDASATWPVPGGASGSKFGGVTTSVSRAMHDSVSVGIPDGVKALATVRAWATVELGPGSSAVLYRNNYAGGSGEHVWVSNDSTSKWSDPKTMSAVWAQVSTGPFSYQPWVRISGSCHLPYTQYGHLVGSAWEWRT
jgi:hypothetical protein